MKVTIFVAMVLTSILLAVNHLFAWDVTPSGVNVTVSYTEPTTNEDGSALTDLKGCTISYDMGAGWTAGSVVAASKPSGGGNQTAIFEVPILAGMERDVKFKGACSDTSQNISKDSSIITKRIDRLPPGTIQ